MNRGNHSRSVFLLMELLLTFLIFCFCAAIILQVFSKGVTISRRVENTSSALLRAESIAEEIKAGDGSMDYIKTLFGSEEETSFSDNIYTIHYDKEWNQVESEDAFLATVSVHQLDNQILSVDIVIQDRNQVLTSISMQQYYPDRQVIA